MTEICKFFEQNSGLVYENVLFSIGPLSAILAARRGLKSWLRYEIAVSVVFAFILLFKPDFILSEMVIFLIESVSNLSFKNRTLILK
jgi:hypothetical protein